MRKSGRFSDLAKRHVDQGSSIRSCHSSHNELDRANLAGTALIAASEDGLPKDSIALEAEYRLLEIVNFVGAVFGIGNNPLHVFEISINEVHTLPSDDQPRSTIDPRTPLIKMVTTGPAKSFTSSATSRRLSIEKGSVSE